MSISPTGYPATTAGPVYDTDNVSCIGGKPDCNDSLWDLNGTTSLPMDVSPTYMDPAYYSINYRIIGTIFQGIIFSVGVLGNIMVVIVVIRTRSMHTPTNCYLVSLSCADMMVLVASVPNEVLSYYLLGDEWIWGRAGCAIFIFLQYLGINASSLSITAFTVERYIAICHPMKAQTICTVSRAKKIILGVWIFSCIYCSPWIVLTKTAPIYYKGHKDKETCTYALSRTHYLGYYMADLVLFYILPLLIYCVLYALIARILFTNDILKTPGKTANSSASETESRKTNANTSSRIQVVKMLVVVVLVFAILWMPYRVLVVYNSFTTNRYMELWFLMFCKTMIFINSAINPILYNAMSVKFRRAFKKMLSCNSTMHRSKSHPAGTYVSAGESVKKENTLLTSTFRTTSSTSSRKTTGHTFTTEQHAV